jgi:hypothetical protein
MGLFDRFRRKRDERPADGSAGETEAEPVEAATAVEPPPDVVALARRGMDVPPDDYIGAVLAIDCAGALAETTVRVGLSQPRWPANAQLIDSTASAIVRAMAREHGIAANKSSYVETRGPDGAQVLLVMMWR